MQIHLITVGKLKEKWLRDAYAEYDKRLQRYCRLTLTEGKTHQVKRMLAQTGRSVIFLHRESIGSLHLKEDQEPGEMYALSKEDIRLLKEGN